MKNRSFNLALLSAIGLGLSAFEPRRNMIVSSPIFNEISGKLGGAVGMTTRFGMLLRGNTTPNNPDSPNQFIVRNILASLAGTWRNTLTALQRQGWDDLADDTPGAASGLGLFVRGNTELLRATIPYVPAAPATASALFTPPTAVSVDVSDARVNFTLPAAGVDSYQFANGCINVYISREQPVSRTTRIHPFTFWGYLKGDVAFGAKNVAMPPGVALVAGKVVYVKFTTTTPDARRSQDLVQRIVVQA